MKPQGISLVELVIVLCGMTVVGAMAAPMLGRHLDDETTRAAARHLSALLQQARIDAIKQTKYVAIRFQVSATGIRYASFADGNANGVRSTDISRGTDPQVSPWESITDHFAGVTFGIVPGITDIDSGEALTGDAVRIGGSDLLSFSPAGTVTSGTLYLRGRSDEQYAIRVLGATGRVRLLHFIKGTRQWAAP